MLASTIAFAAGSMTARHETIDVLVMHPEPLIREGLLATLCRHEDLSVTMRDASDLEDEGAPDLGPYRGVIVTDHAHAMALAASAHRDGSKNLRLKVMVVTRQDRDGEYLLALRQGIQGYMVIGAPLGEFVDGVRALAAGSRYVCQAVAQRVAESIAHEPLTTRETDVLKSLASGSGNKVIARELGIAADTVKTHVRSIFAKLQAASRTEAAAVAMRRGLV